MSNHIELDEATSKSARELKDCVRKLRTEMARLDGLFDSLDQMKDGDGSQASHFTFAAGVFSVQAEGSATAAEECKALYDELNSTKGNSAALRQLINKLGY